MWIVSAIGLGILIGVLVSAPMGPVGVLCIRRTLHRGRKAGIITGVGALISDLLYATLTYKGVSVVLDFIYRYELILQILGSILVLSFGVYMYFSIPNYDVKDKVRDNNYWRLLSSAFFFALGNPLIAFVYLAFFSRYNFVPDTPTLGLHFVVAMASIALGAFLWWTLITYLVLRLKESVSLGGLRIFNRVLALVFIGISILGLAMSIVKFC